jgi:hypothetical protein
MDHHAVDLANLFKRLDRLERQNLLWRGLSLAVILLLGIGLLAGAANPRQDAKDTVVAKDFQLVDAKGKMRARLFMTNFGQPALAMFDENDKERINMVIAKDGPKISCFSTTGNNMLTMGADATAGYMLLNNAEKQSCFVANSVGTRVSRLFQVVDDKNRIRVNTGIEQGGAYFGL